MERGSEDGGWRTDEIQAAWRQGSERKGTNFVLCCFVPLYKYVSSDVPPTTHGVMEVICASPLDMGEIGGSITP